MARFLTLDDLAEQLGHVQIAGLRALVRNKQLRAVKIGGRGQRRVEQSELGASAQRLYAETEQWIDTHPCTVAEDEAPESP